MSKNRKVQEYQRFSVFCPPDLKLPVEFRLIGMWSRMHRDYLKEHCPILYTNLDLNGTLWTYLIDLNEQVREQL